MPRRKARLPQFNFSADVIAANPDLFSAGANDLKEQAAPNFKSDLERDYAIELSARGLRWIYEPVTFHLPGKVAYTPDFIVFGHPITMIECKGSMKMKGARDSWTRFRIASSIFWFFGWTWVTRDKGRWIEIPHEESDHNVR